MVERMIRPVSYDVISTCESGTAAPTWPPFDKKICFTISKNWAPLFDPLCVSTCGQRKLAPPFLNPKYATDD